MFGRMFVAVVVVGAVSGTGPVFAQEDLNRGKTPAQLFVSDCADCHKNPRALGNRENAGALAGFLRVHYTASRESAAAIAGYLAGLPADRPAAARPSGPARPRPAASQDQKQDQSKSSPAAKPAEEAAPKPPEPVPQAPAAAAPAAPASEPAPAPPPANPQ